MKILPININVKPLKELHLTYSYIERDDEIILTEIVERFYNHPQAPDHAMISLLEEKRLKFYKKNDTQSAQVHLLKWANENIRL